MKVAIAAFAFLMFIAVGCNKDQQTSKDLNGTWKLEKVNEDPVDEDFNYTITYNKDKDGKGTGNVSYNEGATTITRDFNYSVDGDKIQMESEGEIDTAIIITLDKDILRVNQDEHTSEYSKQ